MGRIARDKKGSRKKGRDKQKKKEKKKEKEKSDHKYWEEIFLLLKYIANWKKKEINS